jgi:type III restriction enzyme
MPALPLKNYQQQALDSLRHFLRDAARTGSLPAAWALEHTRQASGGDGARPPPYRDEPFGTTPCVCLRIPTGGGKTLLAAHAIALMAREWRQADFPVALWLVPSTTIRDQTVKALQTSGHPCRDALEAAYGAALVVLDLDAVPTLAPHDLGRKAVVLVATIQSVRVRQTQGRNAYAFSEAFDAHFAHFRAVAPPDAFHALERVTEADVREAGQVVLTAADIGRVKHSLANLLALTRPVVVVDEAHNAKTDTTFETLKRFSPSGVLDLSATPVPRKTNVLYSVSARELQAEDMIKLPVMLAEHAVWQEAVRDAVLRRSQLEAESEHEDRYVRPIALFQAQDRSGAVTPEALRQHLLDEKLVADPQEIVVATGDQRGLDGVDLFDRACPVRHVITIEALKEGWDCSFAYVLCSLQNVKSSKDVEQLLGRVLRMPYAARRKSALLNRAYAHVVASSFSEAATALRDRMVQGMGFEAMQAATAVLRDEADLFEGKDHAPPAVPVFEMAAVLTQQAQAELEADPDIRVEAAGGSAVDATAVLRVVGELTPARVEQIVSAVEPAQRESVQRQLDNEVIRRHAQRAPALRGVPFAPLPNLCVTGGAGQQELHLFERDTLDEVAAFDLLRADPRPRLDGLHFAEQATLIEIGLDGQRLTTRLAKEDAQLSLDSVPTHATEQDLVVWLVDALRRPSLTESELRRWVAMLVGELLREQGKALTGLVRVRHVLAQAAMRRLDDLQSKARTRGFVQLFLVEDGAAAEAEGWRLVTSPSWQFAYRPGQYPARNVYAGSWGFDKHYFEVIHGLRAKGEEFECAKLLDTMPEVRHWVRNIERQRHCSFWLPTATDYFYPDFVAELADGRLLVVEYKGEAYATNDDSREKRAVGAAWARVSEGRAVFVMVEKELDGLDMSQQLRRSVAR